MLSLKPLIRLLQDVNHVKESISRQKEHSQLKKASGWLLYESLGRVVMGRRQRSRCALRWSNHLKDAVDGAKLLGITRERVGIL
jgi:hypothetical protein